jgi:hypothetical protein
MVFLWHGCLQDVAVEADKQGRPRVRYEKGGRVACQNYIRYKQLKVVKSSAEQL